MPAHQEVQVAQKLDVFVCVPPEVIILSVRHLEDRELARQSLKDAYRADYVWFSDEAYTDKDPMLGPNPVYSKANRRHK